MLDRRGRQPGGQNPDQDQSLGTAVTWKSARRLSRPRTLHVDDRTSKTLGTPPRGRQGPARDQVGSGKLVALRRRRARTPGTTRFSPVATRQRISPRREPRRGEGRGCRGVCFSFLILLGQRIRALTARRGMCLFFGPGRFGAYRQAALGWGAFAADLLAC